LQLQRLNVCRAGTFGALFDIEPNPLTFIERFKTCPDNGAVMDKNIAAFIILDETEPLLFVKPLYLSFCQSYNPPLKFFKTPQEIKKPHQFFQKEESSAVLFFLVTISTNYFPNFCTVAFISQTLIKFFS